MKLEKIKEERKKNRLVFFLKGGDEVFANTLRRLMLEEVPTLAVEDLEIKENNSALYDEMLGLRLGLIPLKTDLKSYTFKESCKCGGEGCARCELKIHLKASKKGYVYAEEAESADPKCTFAYEKMPVVKLLAKQKVDVQMTAVLGKGINHAKWAPGFAYYRKSAKVDLGKVADPQKIAKLCPDGVFTLQGSKLTVDQEAVNSSQLLDYYASLDKGISVEYNDDLVFNVESWGQLSCKEMLSAAADILLEKVAAFEELITKN